MCRFIAYFGKNPIILSDVIEKPDNSLVNQSKHSQEGKLGLNADGFGVSWYDFSVDKEPGLFRSIQPAWSDRNLYYLSNKIRSNCFLGHVRASTVGDVNILNCHPFVHQVFSFVHNGTIKDFDLIKKQLVHDMSDESFNIVKGQTDSEYIFALILDDLQNCADLQKITITDISSSFVKAIKKIQLLKESLNINSPTKINSVFTDGSFLFATRYISESDNDALSLYYTKDNNSIVVASEPVYGYASKWDELPSGSMMLVSKDLDIEYIKI